jgi:hypothetical protein
MTIEFDNYVSDEELATAAEFYDDLEFELDALELETSLDALEEETRLADAEWDEHWHEFDMELLDDNGEFETE